MALAETTHGKFFYFEPDVIGQAVACGAFWDEHFRPWIDKLGPGGVLIDVGANIGFFTIYCARRGARVIAFEACPEVFDLLKRNVEINELGQLVQLHNVALYDRVVELTLNPEWNDWPQLPDGRPDYEHYCNSGGLSLVPGRGQGYTMWSRTLDSYSLDAFDLIKVDTQGADLRVLVGGLETIKRFRPVVCFEIEHIPARLHGDTPEMYFEFFKELGYSIIRVGGGATNNDYAAVSG